MSVIRLFDFQEAAVARVLDAVNDWTAACAAHGPPRLGRQPIPFVGLLKAVTGAGKTPMLAAVCQGLGSAVVLWTSKSSAVVDQTYKNLQGKYAGLLPSGTRVIRERPSRGDWEHLIASKAGVDIWVTTVGSWNEAEAVAAGGSADARLNMHRPHPDWGGKLSPWEQLRTRLKRPLWVIYDEGHNQTPTQLDQLVRLEPMGFLLASATPPASELFGKLNEAIRDDEIFGPIASQARVSISTADVVKAQLLKHTLEVLDYQAEPEAMLDEVVDRFRRLEKAVGRERSSTCPRAVYVVEESNPRRGSTELSRPVAIWNHLRRRKIPADEIALYTQTKELPDDAEKVSSLSALQDRHRHIIFNRALQEGWDDPEAYLCYFDGETNSYTRIQQIIGRVLRQPMGRHSGEEALNTATLFIRVPNRKYEEIIRQIKNELSLYALDADDPFGGSAIRLKTRSEPLKAVPVKSAGKRCSIPNYVLGDAQLDSAVRQVEARGRSMWAEADLIAKGTRRSRTIALEKGSDRVKFEEFANNIRTPNADYFRRKLLLTNRWAAHQVHADSYSGPSFHQASCPRSAAQEALATLAGAVATAYEQSVEYQKNEIASERSWHAAPHRPSGADMLTFRHATHASYSRKSFNKDEREFAEALDSFGKGTWCRNPSTPGEGWALPLPSKVGDSLNFFPDFLWWVKKTCLAIDTTGRHILQAKVRGKLMSIDLPTIVLATRGKVAPDFATLQDDEGWTFARARRGMPPVPQHCDTLDDLIKALYDLA